MQIKKLTPNLIVRSVERSLKFYREVLGLEKIARPPFEEYFRALNEAVGDADPVKSTALGYKNLSADEAVSCRIHGVTPVVAINAFPTDHPSEQAAVRKIAEELAPALDHDAALVGNNPLAEGIELIEPQLLMPGDQAWILGERSETVPQAVLVA